MADAKEIADDVLKRIDSIAEKFGVAADQVWDFSKRAKKVNAKRNVIQALVGIVVAIIFGIIAYIFLNAPTHDLPGTNTLSEGSAFHIAVGLLSTLVSITVGITSTMSAIDGVAANYTAEYDAFKEIVKDIRGS